MEERWGSHEKQAEEFRSNEVVKSEVLSVPQLETGGRKVGFVCM